MEPEASPPPSGRTLAGYAAHPSSCSVTLALPTQKQKSAGSGFGGGREDCWTEEATALLIDAWGERYMELSRGNLKQKHWKDVAEIVNTQEGFSKTPKTDVQCKNRIDTVKKKYKTEKAKVVSGCGPSKWRFFDRLDELLVPTGKISSGSLPSDPDRLTRSSSATNGKFQSQQKRSRRRPHVQSCDDSESENSVDSSDGLSPRICKRPRSTTANYAPSLRPCVMNNKAVDSHRGNAIEPNSWASCIQGLTQTILRFGEAYEQVETEKLQQLMDMEKQRMKLTKELELQRMRCLMETQMELSQLKNRRPANKD